MDDASLRVRAELAEALRLDLVGPDNRHAFAHELLPEAPSRWYLTGYLVPRNAPVEQRRDETAHEEIDEAADASGTDDATSPDRAAARQSLLPSSIGLSVLVSDSIDELNCEVEWGEYRWEGPEQSDVSKASEAPVAGPPTEDQIKAPRGYRRIPRTEPLSVKLPVAGSVPKSTPVPNSNGLILVVTRRKVPPEAPLPEGTFAVSVFLVNERAAGEDDRAWTAFVFQVQLTLRCAGFIPRPDLRGLRGAVGEWDERVGDLHYRDVFEYAVGHGVSSTADLGTDGSCLDVRSAWIPSAEVERVVPSEIAAVEWRMEALGALTSGEEARENLGPLLNQYRAWMVSAEGKLAELEGGRLETARELLNNAEHTARRIEAGIAALKDPDILDAFKTANRAMAQAARRREAIQRQVAPAAVPIPVWRPFQLAFILMALPGIGDPLHDDRETVDLLFFPTGGGKTEAYLGLAAFTLVLRRLRYPGIRSAGLSVLMRYTLRLLTLDQLGRAAAMMCALELEREGRKEQLGTWPFEIGLWVGSAATPNRMGERGYKGPGKEKTAYARTQRFHADSGRNASPIPIENCPWCGTKFATESFRLVPSVIHPKNLEVRCSSYKCEFSRARSLPIVGVDEPIYRRLPAFIIGTVDKFAALPWTGETGCLFGLADRYDKDGFYGPCSPGIGTALGGPLPPPDLIIQDELHLISGPLGTVAGVYETAIDALASRVINGRTIRAKIVASTATVRRADSQIRALFERPTVAVFPPPGPDRRDSFFAHTEPSTKTPARLYLGVAAQGKSLKVVLLRVALAILGAAQAAWEREGGRKNRNNPADPYMTLLGYFNSLRELGGSRRIIEDEVLNRVANYGAHKRREPEDTLFASRQISYEVLELTSRVPTNQVASAKRRLALSFNEDERVDVALATNMISVGLDIVRLGLMTVLGQPKQSAEYIQSTSRVGRVPERPGLVITLLNVHKPRDRSHYERFATYHASFYRAVEPTSVTPFSPRALDRALVGALVALCRQGDPAMTPPEGVQQIAVRRAALETFVRRFAERAREHDASMEPAEIQALVDNVTARCRRLLDDWLNIIETFRQTNTPVQYQRYEANTPARLLYDLLEPDLATLPAVRRKFRANRSMRDVEPSVELTVKPLNDWPDRQ